MGRRPLSAGVDPSSRREPYPENVRVALELNVLAEAAILSAQEGQPIWPELPRLDRL
jgi:hypothetical protein